MLVTFYSVVNGVATPVDYDYQVAFALLQTQSSYFALEGESFRGFISGPINGERIVCLMQHTGEQLTNDQVNSLLKQL